MAYKKAKSILPALVVIAVVLVGAFGFFNLAASFSGSSKYVIENWNGDLVEGSDGSLGGAVHNIQESFDEGILVDGLVVIDGKGNLTELGSVLTVASGSTTYTAANLCDSSLVRHSIVSAPASAQQFKLPTAAAIIADCLPNAGGRHRFTIENYSDFTAEALTIVKGANIDLGVASGSAVGAGKGDGVVLLGQTRAIVEMLNLNGSSVSFDVIEIIDGD